jgi:histone acetyltransferase (RNA polymerase elongator complex component)
MIKFLQIKREAHIIQVAYADNKPPQAHLARPLIIPLFIPHQGCPHRCTFCNQHTITGPPDGSLNRLKLSAIVDRFLGYRRRGHGIIQIAFFGGNFLGLPPDRVRHHLAAASAYVRQGAVDNLRFSTRPDTISPATLELIRTYPVRTVELGVQSMDDGVLAAARRGHWAADTIQAVRRLKAAGYEIGLQIMTGLPDDTPAKATATVEAIIDLQPAFVRIYPTLVIAGSPLAADYQAKRYRPAPLSASLDLVARLWLRLTAAGIRVVRMGLQDNPAMIDRAQRLAGPYHPAFGELVRGRIFRAMAHAALKRSPGTNGRLVVRVNPRRVSVMTGPHRQNLLRLQKTFGLDNLRVKGDATLAPNQLTVDNRQAPIQPSV